MKRLLILNLLLFADLASGQLTVTASRNPDLRPDQVVFGVSVTSPVDSTLDDILAALKDTGITRASFVNLGSAQAARVSAQAPQFLLQWIFTLPVPLASMKTTAALLTAAQTNIAKGNSGLTLSFTTQGTGVSPELQQSQACTWSALVADARAQAQKLAAATGLPVGNFAGLSSALTVTNPGSGIIPNPAYLPSCFLSARFAPAGSAENNLLTMTASRPLTIQPDQVAIAVYATAGGTALLEDVLAALAGTGITAANLSSVYTVPLAERLTSTQWVFTLNVPFAKLKDTLATLARIQQGTGPVSVTYGVQGLQISPELQAAQACPLTALVGDAQDQARKLAAAAGVTLGPIAGAAQGGIPQVVPSLAYRQGDFSTIFDPITGGGSISAILSALPLPVTQLSCSMTVQFKLTS